MKELYQSGVAIHLASSLALLPCAEVLIHIFQVDRLIRVPVVIDLLRAGLAFPELAILQSLLSSR
jgi:hypothetical protein